MWKYLWTRAHWFYYFYEFYCYLHCIKCCVLYSDHLGGKPKCKRAAVGYYLQQRVLLLTTVVIAPEDLRALVRSGADGGRTSGQLVWWVGPFGHYVFSHQANEVTAILRSHSIIPLFKSGTFVYWANLKASAFSNKTQLLVKKYFMLRCEKKKNKEKPFAIALEH